MPTATASATSATSRNVPFSLFPSSAPADVGKIPLGVPAPVAEGVAHGGAVVRTRIFVTDIARWEEVGRAHSEFFGEVRPSATMLEVRRLVDERMLVEIEVEAHMP